LERNKDFFVIQDLNLRFSFIYSSYFKKPILKYQSIEFLYENQFIEFKFHRFQHKKLLSTNREFIENQKKLRANAFISALTEVLCKARDKKFIFEEFCLSRSYSFFLKFDLNFYKLCVFDKEKFSNNDIIK
jgi:hypothetical protein